MTALVPVRPKQCLEVFRGCLEECVVVGFKRLRADIQNVFWLKCNRVITMVAAMCEIYLTEFLQSCANF